MSGVCDDSFGAREIGPLFNLSMQTRIDEIYSTKHLEMQYIEFVECLARIADKAVHKNTVDFPIELDITAKTSLMKKKASFPIGAAFFFSSNKVEEDLQNTKGATNDPNNKDDKSLQSTQHMKK